MTQAVGRFTCTRGETLTFGLRATPAYDGSEVVRCDIKLARNGFNVPSEDTAITATPSVDFVEAAGEVAAHWLFTLSAAQTAVIDAGNYIADAKVTADGAVDYVDPIIIVVGGRVTI